MDGYYDGIPKEIEEMSLDELEIAIEKEKERCEEINAQKYRITETLKLPGEGITVYFIKCREQAEFRVGDVFSDLHGNRARVKAIEMIHRKGAIPMVDGNPIGVLFEMLDGEKICGDALAKEDTKMIVKKIYFDMDGVLADFERGVEEICGLTPQSQNGKHRSPAEDDEMWARIKLDEHFYDHLEIMPGAKELFDAVYGKYRDKCEILTGIPKPKRGIESAGDDKISWVRRLLSEDIKVNIVFREEKPQFCTGKECILIDDLEKNINEWESMGGTGILFTDAESTMQKLKELNVI